jgi:dTDP-4-dehydrorhamnose 3,5-epimerase/CDP-3, 6-dideoxy-D-glycero-D-glycero-4-hexulose-5-epimerase
MKLVRSDIEGVFIVDNFSSYDVRGGFIKVFNNNLFLKENIVFNPEEIYYSISKKDVIRGMHFQTSPYEHAKLIYVTSGSIIDVVLDIRKYSKTYGQTISMKMEAYKDSLYIPSGCAHGFMSLEDGSTVVYNQTSCYSKEHDFGILWNSFGFDWGIENPIISERDKTFPILKNFATPFQEMI